jgi:hypothetical protein
MSCYAGAIHTGHSLRGAQTGKMRTFLTLDFINLLTQHTFAPAARLLSQRGACRHCGRSLRSIPPEATLDFRRS